MKTVSKELFLRLFPDSAKEGILGVVECWTPTHMVCYEAPDGNRIAIPVGRQNTRKTFAMAENPVFCEIAGELHTIVGVWEVGDAT